MRDAAQHDLIVLWGFVMQVGLVDMLREEYGVTASGCFGHSAGLLAPHTLLYPQKHMPGYSMLVMVAVR